MVIYTRTNCQGSTFEQLWGAREPRLLIKVKEGPRKCIVYSSVHFPSRNSALEFTLRARVEGGYPLEREKGLEAQENILISGPKVCTFVPLCDR